MHITAMCTWQSRSEGFVTCYLAGQYLLVVIFLPLTVLVEVDTDRKLPMLPPPPPPKEVDEKEVKPPPPILPIVVMWPMWPIWPTALMEPKEPKAKSKKLICLIHLSKRSTLPTVLEPLCSSGSFTLANSLPGSKGEKPAPKAGKPKPPKKGPPVRLRLARLWCRRPLPKNESSLNGSAPERRKSQSARITQSLQTCSSKLDAVTDSVMQLCSAERRAYQKSLQTGLWHQRIPWKHLLGYGTWKVHGNALHCGSAPLKHQVSQKWC